MDVELTVEAIVANLIERLGLRGLDLGAAQTDRPCIDLKPEALNP